MDANCFMIGSAVRWRHRSISSEGHRPRIWMMLVSIVATNNAIAPAARRDRAETSDVRKPKSATRYLDVDLRVVVMREVVTDWVLEPLPVEPRLKGMYRGVFLVVSLS